MKPLEAWHIVRDCMDGLSILRQTLCDTKGYSEEEIQATVITF